MQMGSQSGSVEVEGATLRFALEGHGTPVLVVGSAIYYPRTFSQQLRKSCRLAFVDLRHFAETDESVSLDSIGLTTYADDIEKVRAAVGFERFVLVGHSHHGNLALEYAKRHPDKVSHLVLIGTPPCNVQQTITGGDQYWEQHASPARKALLERQRDALKPDWIASLSPAEAFTAHYIADGPKYWYDPEYDASHLWQGVPVNMDIIKLFRGFFTDYEFSWDPAQMKAPVLSVMGKHDYVVPHILWNEIRRNLPNFTYHLLEKSGHTPQLEEPTVFDRIFLEWIKRESV